MPLVISQPDPVKYSDLEIALAEIEKHANALQSAQKTLNVLAQKFKQRASMTQKEMEKLNALRAKGNQTVTQSIESYMREDDKTLYFSRKSPDVLIKNLKYVYDSLEKFKLLSGPNGSMLKFLRSRGDVRSGADNWKGSGMRDLYKKFGTIAVEYIQAGLHRLGFNPGPVDGQYGNKVFKAVQEFQKANGLSVDGDAGLKTVKKMIELISKESTASTQNTGNISDKNKSDQDIIQTNSMQEDSYDEPASDYESEMLDNQIAFIKYAADEIRDHVHKGGVFPEWFQNKLSGVHEKIKTLHAYMEGERQQAMEKKRMMSMKDAQDDYFESLERKLNESKGLCKECGKPSYTTLPEEKQKGVDGKVCWKGYKRMGTKKKGGKTVDNCVKM